MVLHLCFDYIYTKRISTMASAMKKSGDLGAAYVGKKAKYFIQK